MSRRSFFQSLALSFALTFAASFMFFATPASTASPVEETDIGRLPIDVEFRWGLRIPLRDGVELNGSLFLPKGQAGPVPVIVVVTPYISDRYQPDAQYFARHGYAFVIVDSRGRGNSDGAFIPNVNESDDGHDVIEWLAKQPWSNGKVAMRGGSYSGYNQWATVRKFPPHLKTIVPIASAFMGTDFPMDYNVPYPYSIRWTTFTSGRTSNGKNFGDTAFWNRKFREYHTKHLAFRDLDELVGNTTTEFDTWLDHPTQDAYWAALNPSDEEFSKIDLPILTITGYYDGDQPGAMRYYRSHMKHGTKAAKKRHYLLFGPWNHSGTRFPKAEFGGIKLGDKSLFDAWGLDKAWYDWTMRKGPFPEFLKDRVTYFVTGANKWKSAPSLAAIADGEINYYLASNGSAGDLYHSGSLQADKPGQEQVADSYTYDPMDTTKAEQEGSKNYITDQSELAGTAGDGLIYHSAPFAESAEITGYVRFEAWIGMNVPDTDLVVSLYEILPDGSSILLTHETQRARYRTSLEEETLIVPGEINLFTFERFRFFSRQIAKGSRLRLFIRPANGLHQQRNYNSGGAVADETGADARTAVVTLYHDATHPSKLTLPAVSKD